jgi:hypothetical protein
MSAVITRGGQVLRPHVGFVDSGFDAFGVTTLAPARGSSVHRHLRRVHYYAEFLKVRHEPWWPEEPAPLEPGIDLFEQLDIKAGFPGLLLPDFFWGAPLVDPKREDFAWRVRHGVPTNHQVIAAMAEHESLELRARALFDILEADLRQPFIETLARVRQRKPWERDDV